MAKKTRSADDAQLQTEGVLNMVTAVEESTRATALGVSRFVEPAQGTLRRAVSKRHHIVFGRRGSGKTSLLRKAAAELTIDRRPIAFIDLEPFKGHTYPDVLLSVLIETFGAFAKWLNEAGRAPASKTSFWTRLFGTKPTRPPLSKSGTVALVEKLAEQIKELKLLLHMHDNAAITLAGKTSAEESSLLGAESKAELGVSELVKVTAASSASHTTRFSQGHEWSEEFRRSKIDFLHRHIIDYQDIFREMAVLSQGDTFLFWTICITLIDVISQILSTISTA